VRVPDGDDELPDPQRRSVTEPCRNQVARLGAEDCKVGERVGADQVGPQRAAVRERGRRSPRAPHDMRRGEQEPIRCDRDRATGAVSDLQVRNRRRKPFRDLCHYARLRVERLVRL
jgi:hypothetical protein